MGRWSVFLASCLLFFQILPAQNRQRSRSSERLPSYFKAFQSHEEKEGLTRAVFKNGLTVVVEEHPSSPLVAVVTLVRLGTRSEVDPELVAEFVGQPFRESIASFGGFGEVRNGVAESLFASVVPAEKILDVLESHTGLFSPRSYDAEILEFLADGIKRDRLNQTGDQPVRETLLNKYYRAVDNTDLVVPSKEKYLEFCRTHYQPNNVIVAVSGSSRNEQILSELVDLLVDKKPAKVAGAVELAREQAGSSKGFSYHHLRGDIGKPLILLGYPIPGFGHKDYPALKLLEYVLGEGNSALLNSSHDDEGSNAFLARISLEKACGRGAVPRFACVGAERR